MLEPTIGVTRATSPGLSGKRKIAKSIRKQGQWPLSSSLERSLRQPKRQESNGRREAFRLTEREKL
jgi:hypothetical protein